MQFPITMVAPKRGRGAATIMRQTLAVLGVAALAMSAMPARLGAQRGGGIRGGAPFAAPRAPGRSDPQRPVLSEPQRPSTHVPYVRDNNWYGHATPTDTRFQLARPFASGRFTQVGPGHVFRAARTDLAARHVWLPGGEFEIVPSEWDVTAPWCWTCDDFVVYDDPDHAGWYMLYDTRMGEYVHAQLVGL